MTLRPEIVNILQREKAVCGTAMMRLQEKIRLLENRFGWSTDVFLELFNTGQAGDKQEFFRWYAMAEALKEWQETQDYLQEILSDVELVSA